MRQNSHENKVNDHKLDELLIVRQILPLDTEGNVKRTVWRNCKLVLGYRGLIFHHESSFFHLENFFLVPSTVQSDSRT